MKDSNIFGKNYFPFYPWKYLSNWGKNAKLIIHKFKYAYQRITKGFCSYDCWDLDHYLARVICDSVKYLADEGYDFPGNEEFPTEESWKKYLYTIVDLLEVYLDDEIFNVYEEKYMKMVEKKGIFTNSDYTPEEQELFNNYSAIEIENSNFKSEALQGALEKLAAVWENLWD